MMSVCLCVCACACVCSCAGTEEVVERVKSCCRIISTGIRSQGRKKERGRERRTHGWIDIFIEDR